MGQGQTTFGGSSSSSSHLPPKSSGSGSSSSKLLGNQHDFGSSDLLSDSSDEKLLNPRKKGPKSKKQSLKEGLSPIREAGGAPDKSDSSQLNPTDKSNLNPEGNPRLNPDTFEHEELKKLEGKEWKEFPSAENLRRTQIEDLTEIAKLAAKEGKGKKGRIREFSNTWVYSAEQLESLRRVSL